ncbi:MAG: acyl-CoA thioesterase [Thermoanaerobaculia bacterium]
MSGRDKQIPRHATSGWRDGWYVAPMHVILRDLDAFGHVNHAVYLTYFEWARTEMWRELTGRDDVRGITFILARAECDYRLQLALEPIEVAVRIQDMRSTSLDFVSEIRKADGRVAATGKVVVVLFDYKTQSKVPVSDELRKAVALFQKEED